MTTLLSVVYPMTAAPLRPNSSHGGGGGVGAGAVQPKVARAASCIASESSRATPRVVARGVAAGVLRCRPRLSETRRSAGLFGAGDQGGDGGQGHAPGGGAGAVHYPGVGVFRVRHGRRVPYPEDDTPSEANSYTDNDGEGALVDAVHRVFSSWFAGLCSLLALNGFCFACPECFLLW